MLKSVNCGVFFGIKKAKKLPAINNVKIVSSLQYYINKNNKDGSYKRMVEEIRKTSVYQFMLILDDKIFTDRDELYNRLIYLQDNIIGNDFLLNDFKMTNDMFNCPVCLKDLRIVFKESHENHCGVVGSTYKVVNSDM
jgi:hypothetical protein